MAEGLIDADTPLDAWTNIYDWLKMHIGAPGAAGTSNPATETDRASVTWSLAASGGADTNIATVDYTNVAATETWTHCTMWDASTAGNCGGSGTVTNGAVVAGADVSIEIGDLDASFPLAS